ncbi:MAG: amidohydrolase family protein [Acidobacteriota bacterium]
MLIDVHSHTYRYPDHFTAAFRQQFHRCRNQEIDLTVRWEEYETSSRDCRKSVVFGGKARSSGIWVPDHYVFDYVSRHPDKLVGFMSLDPTQPGWQQELEEGHQDLKLKGIKLLPMYAGFKPNEQRLDFLWQYATRHGLPVLLHMGTTFIDSAPLDCTWPWLIDEVARRFRDVKIVMAHLAHPYEGECVATIRKHPNVYADCSALHYRPFQLYRSLMLVQEYGVWDKLLFGSDYPVTTVDASVEGIRNLNRMVEGTALPRLDAIQLEAMLQRDTLKALAIEA